MRRTMFAVLVALTFICSACATVDGGFGMEGGVVIGSPPPPADEGGGPGYGAQGPPGVPRGHIPPPGECRIWYPGGPPGQQPPPGRCEVLSTRVPPGAWLVYGGPENGKYRVEEYDRQRTGLVISVRIYDVNTGTLIRVEKR